MRCLSATGAKLERDFSFGIVRQLFESRLHGAEPDQRERWLAGAAAALAAPIFEFSDEGGESADVSHARLHGLYWLTANVADEQPLVLIVDDAHWADAPSLRFVEALSRRVEDLPVVLAVGTRPAEPDAEQELLESIAMGPLAVVLRPAALSAEGVGTLLCDALGRQPEAEFGSVRRNYARQSPSCPRAVSHRWGGGAAGSGG